MLLTAMRYDESESKVLLLSDLSLLLRNNMKKASISICIIESWLYLCNLNTKYALLYHLGHGTEFFNDNSLPLDVTVQH